MAETSSTGLPPPTATPFASVAPLPVSQNRTAPVSNKSVVENHNVSAPLSSSAVEIKVIYKKHLLDIFNHEFISVFSALCVERLWSMSMLSSYMCSDVLHLFNFRIVDFISLTF